MYLWTTHPTAWSFCSLTSSLMIVTSTHMSHLLPWPQMNLASFGVNWTSALEFGYLILTTAFFLLFCFSFSDTPTIPVNPLNWGFQSHLFSVRTSHKQETLFQKQSNQSFGKQCFLISLGLGNIRWFSPWGASSRECLWIWGLFCIVTKIKSSLLAIMVRLAGMLFILQSLEQSLTDKYCPMQNINSSPS